MKLSVDWSTLKSFATTRGISIQYFDINGKYYLFASDGPMSISTQILKEDPASADQTDFETNYKAGANKSQPTQIQPFASKTLPNGKNLYKRFTGASFDLAVGANTFTWTQSSFPWVKFLGIEVINGEIGDTCSLYVLDTVSGTFSGYPNAPLNQFAFSANIAPGYYKHVSEYDADMYQGLQIKFVYNSVSAKTLRINFDMNEVK